MPARTGCPTNPLTPAWSRDQLLKTFIHPPSVPWVSCRKQLTANCGVGSALTQDLELPLPGTSVVVATSRVLGCCICCSLSVLKMAERVKSMLRAVTLQNFNYSKVTVAHKDARVNKQYWDYFSIQKEKKKKTYLVSYQVSAFWESQRPFEAILIIFKAFLIFSNQAWLCRKLHSRFG